MSILVGWKLVVYSCPSLIGAKANSRLIRYEFHSTDKNE
jgi:hypothetical protein